MGTEIIGRSWGRLFVHLKKMPIEYLFLIIFSIFGLIFVTMIPPGWNTDETNHVYRIFQLAEGNVFSEQVVTPRTGLKAYGGNVPVNLVRLFDKTGANEPGSVGNPDRKIEENLYNRHPDILTLSDNGRRTPMNFSGAALYSPVSYAMFLPVFWLGKLLSLPFFWIIIISRLLAVTLTGLAFFFAIKYSPLGKWIFFAVGLTPTVVMQAATVGADAPQLALCVLFVALVVRLLFVAKESRVLDFGIMTALGTALVLVKFAYAPLLLLLAVPVLIRKELKNRKGITLAAAAIFISLIPGLVWARAISYIDINSNPQADFAAQRLFIVEHPVTYLKTLYYTFFTNRQMALNNIFGSFIWDSVFLPAFYAYLTSAAIVSSLFVADHREGKTTALPRQNYNLWRTALLAICLITVVLIATALYIYSTTLRQSSIVGIQSRYFIPLLPIVLLIFYGNTVRRQKPVKAAIVAMSCIALLGGVLAVHFRLYQTPPLIIP